MEENKTMIESVAGESYASLTDKQRTNIREHNHCIDFVKGIACIMVVFLHVPFPEWVDTVVRPVARFAVPFFFMISGFYLYNPDRAVVSKKMPKKIRRILFLAIFAFCIYTAEAIVFDVIVNKQPLLEFFFENFSVKFWMKFILCNDAILVGGGGVIVWYLWATVYCYLILWIVNKFNLYKYIYWLIPVLIIAHITISLTRNYLFPIGDVEFQDYYVRNWLFAGLPFMLLGCYIAENKEALISRFNNPICLLFAFLSMALSCAESLFYGKLLEVELEVYLFTCPFTFFLFIFAVKNSSYAIWKPMAYIGAKLSLFVYIMHYLIRDGLNSSVKMLSVSIYRSALYKWTQPILVVMVTLIAALIFTEFMNLMRKKEKNK